MSTVILVSALGKIKAIAKFPFEEKFFF